MSEDHYTRLHVDPTGRAPVVLVEVGGEIDLLTAPKLDRQLERAETVVVPPAPVTVDLTRVAFLDAHGLGVLVRHHHRCHSIGSTLRIVAGQRAVLRPIQVTGLDTVLHVVSKPSMTNNAGVA